MLERKEASFLYSFFSFSFLLLLLLCFSFQICGTLNAEIGLHRRFAFEGIIMLSSVDTPYPDTIDHRQNRPSVSKDGQLSE